MTPQAGHNHRTYFLVHFEKSHFVLQGLTCRCCTTECVLAESYHSFHLVMSDCYFVRSLITVDKCTLASQFCYLLTNIKYKGRMSSTLGAHHWGQVSRSLSGQYLPENKQGLCLFLLILFVRGPQLLHCTFSSCVIRSVLTSFLGLFGACLCLVDAKKFSLNSELQMKV